MHIARSNEIVKDFVPVNLVVVSNLNDLALASQTVIRVLLL